MPTASIVCKECRISNPGHLKTCVQCGKPLEKSPVVAAIDDDYLSRRKKRLENISEVSRYTAYSSSGVIPGRPPWITIYSLSLALAAGASLVAIAWHLFDGTLMSTYNQFIVGIALFLSNIVAIWAAIELWRMRRTGLVLTLVIQTAWIIAAILMVYDAYTSFPTSWRHEFFINPKQATVEATGVIVGVILLILFAPIWIPAIFGVMRIRGGYSDRFEGIFIALIAMAFVCGFLLMFTALPVIMFQPGLLKLIDPNSPVPGFMRLGFTASIVINLIVAAGLVYENERFN